MLLLIRRGENVEKILSVEYDEQCHASYDADYIVDTLFSLLFLYLC